MMILPSSSIATALGARNNRLEIMAVIKGLEALKASCRVHVFSYSQYVVKGITIWAKWWRAKDPKSKRTRPRPNMDLWIKCPASL